MSYRLDDVWDVNFPADNLHPSYTQTAAGVDFRSAGTLTIRGNYNATTLQFSGEFAEFRTALGLRYPATADHGKQVDITLLTGLDAAVTAALLAKGGEISAADRRLYLERLRQGSRGDRVKKLQAALGLPQTGIIDATITKAYVQFQGAQLGWSDGIHSAEMDQLLKLCIFVDKGC